jgi:hypothetical protein
MHGGACSERPAQVIFTKGKGTGSCRVGDGIRSPEGGRTLPTVDPWIPRVQPGPEDLTTWLAFSSGRWREKRACMPVACPA